MTAIFVSDAIQREQAVKVLDSYAEILTVRSRRGDAWSRWRRLTREQNKSEMEYSEVVMYKLSILEEMGDAEVTLKNLREIRENVADQAILSEKEGACE
jgi:predicted NAD/FAD-binding protein